MADLYEFDNSAFLGALEERGFEVAEDSRAPYVQTLLSMSAIFNRYQGAEYPMLPARSSFSTWEEPFRLTEVEESELWLLPPSSGE